MNTSTICRVGSYSDKGLKMENQDSLGFIFPEEYSVLLNKGIIAAIADGVSGCDLGKEASACAIQNILADYYCTADSWTVKTSIQKVLIALNRWMYQQGQHAGQFRSMATTLSLAIFKSTTAHIFHIGDSRVYLLRQQELQCLTKDHTWKTKEGAQLSRALGIDLNIDIDYRQVALELNDIFIFTTDGVHEYLDNSFIIKTIQQNQTNLNQSAEILIEQALKNGSTDNVSCLLVCFDTLPTQNAEEFYQQLTALPFPPELNVGMKFDGYRILRELHSSKRVQVYQAVDEITHQLVVLKTPSVNYQDDPIYLDLFTHEEWVGKRLKNPHTIQLANINKPKKFLYVVTEYIDGQNLREWLTDKGIISLNEMRSVVQQIGSALQAMHRLEMVHQDLKPENVLRDNHGSIKLIDFGSTRISGIEEISSPLERLHILGTKNYCAPEYFLGLKGSHQADIFSLGVMVYEMLTAHLPYGEKYGEGNPRKYAYIPARHWYQDIPLWVDKAIEKAVQQSPENRYQEVSEFVYDLFNPNPHFLKEQQLPLIERNPIAFWRGLSFILLITELITLANCV